MAIEALSERAPVARVREWLGVGRPSDGLIPLVWRRLGIVWVCVSVPFTAVTSAFVHSPDGYVFVLIFMAWGAYTAPALVAGWYAGSHAPPGDRASYRWLYGGLLSVFATGVLVLVDLAIGRRSSVPAGVVAVSLAGLAHLVGLTRLTRSRSGRRALAVDVIESSASVVAVLAPLVVLWGPAVAHADEAWFTVPTAVILVPLVWGVYWTAVLSVRLGPGRGPFEAFALALSLLGVVNVVLQAAQGVSGFTLWAPPLIALNAVCASMWLLIPLHVPVLLRAGLDRLPPQAQVRGGWLATSVALAGSVALLVATAVVADERPWAVPFALAVVVLLLLLAGLRQIAGVAETRRLYRQVEEASDERRRLLTQMLERSVHDRQRFAGQLHEQAVAAYASFAALSGTGRPAPGLASMVAQASEVVRSDLARHAESLQELILAIRPLEGDRRGGEGLHAPIAAYLATAYGDGHPPHLTVDAAPDLRLDWVTETVLLQVVQEALHNVWRHSRARAVAVTVEAAGEVGGAGATLVVRVADDGVGFDPAAVARESGIAAMRASAAVLGGSLAVASRPGAGTVVTASLGGPGAEADTDASPAPTVAPHLRLVPGLPDGEDGSDGPDDDPAEGGR